jgi:Peptidase_G2, IMC autoproteolytic cleavage domain
MPITPPSKYPEFARQLLNNGPLGSSNRLEPSESKKDTGWNHGERPARQTFNYLHHLTNEWIEYFDAQWNTAGQVNFNFSQNLDLTTGLTFAVDAGTVTFDGVESVIASTSLILNPNSTTVIGFNLDALTISQYTSGGEPTSDFVKLFVVTTNASAITNVDDRRTFFQVQSRLQSGDNKLIIDGATDTFNYTNNGVSVIYADSAGNVGINTATPLGKLHVKQGSSGVGSVSGVANGAVIEHSASTGINIIVPNTQDGNIAIGDPEASFAGGISYLNAGDILALRSAGVNQMTINASGDVGVNTVGGAAQAKLHVREGDSGASALGEGLFVENDGDCYIMVGSSSSASAGLIFADTGSNVVGSVQYSHIEDKLYFGTAGTIDVTIDNQGKVGFGTQSPLANVHVRKGDSGVTPNGNAAAFFIEDATIATGFTIGSANNVECNMLFADPQSNTVGGTQYNHANDVLALRAGDVQSVFVTATGMGVGTNILLGKAHIKQGSSGVGSVLGDANTLVLEDSSSAGLAILTPNTASGNIRFINPESNDAGSWSFNHVDNTHSIQIEGVAKLNVSSATTTVTNDLSVTGNINLNSGSTYKINNTDVLSSTTLGSGVVNSSLTSVGTITSGVWNGTAIANANLANSSLTVNGVLISLGSSGTVTAAAGTLTGTTLNPTIVNSSLTSVGTLGSLAVSGAINAGSLVLTGDLTVNGTVTTINSTTVSVDDKNIELGSVAVPTDATADGGGITLKGTTDKTINWSSITGDFDVSENWDLASGKSYKINGTDVLTSTTLGSGVVNSSLTSVGTLGSLVVSGTQHVGGDTLLGSVSGSALGKLHVKSGASGATPFGNANDVVIEGSTHTGISILTPNTSEASLFFADPESNTVGGISYNHGSNYLALRSNNSQGARLDSSGNFYVESGSLGVGIAPTTKLDVNGGTRLGDGTVGYITTSADGHRLSFSRGDVSHINATNAAGYLGFGTGGVDQRMTLDVSGSLGIGVIPAFRLDVLNNAGAITARIKNENSTSKSGIQFDNHVSTASGSVYYDNNDTKFKVGGDAGVVTVLRAGGTDYITLDTLGNLGIGMLPSSRLTVKNSTGLGTLNIQTGTTTADSVRIQAGGSATNWLEYHGFLGHVFFNDTTEVARIDTAGKLLLGTTSSLAENFHISTGNFGCDATDINGSHDNIVIEDSDGGGITFLVNNTTGGAGIVVNSETSNLTGNDVTNAILGYMSDKHWDVYTGGVNNIRFNATHTLPIGLGGTVTTRPIEVSGDQIATEITMNNTTTGTVSIGVFNSSPGTNKTAGAGFLADYGEVPALQWTNQQVILQNGSESTPSLTFQDDLDNGIFRSSTFTKFVGNGNVVMSIGNGTGLATLNGLVGHVFSVLNTNNTDNTYYAWADDSGFQGINYRSFTDRSPSSLFNHIACNSGGDEVYRVNGNGRSFADDTHVTGGADYAEMFEWLDGNIDSEDRRGCAVSLIGDKIKVAEQGDIIIGIISVNPSILGDGSELGWSGKWLRDEFGTRILDESGNQQYSPEYDPEVEYIPRSKRKEWAPVGLMGKLVLRKGQVTAPSWIKLKDINENLELWLVK